MTPEQLLKIAASLENASDHPLAEAIVTAAKTQNISLDPGETFLAAPGLGVTGTIHQKRFFAENLEFMTENKLAVGRPGRGWENSALP